VLSLILFFYDRDLNNFATLRASLLSAVIPIQRVINFPGYLLQTFSSNFSSRQSLFEENARLRSELLLIHAQLQRLSFLEQENSQLHVLLNSAKQLNAKFLVAQVKSLTAGVFDKSVAVDKGKTEGLYVGQPVLDAYGLFGQVILVESKISTVLLVTDMKSAVPVIIVRNGVQTIAVGTGYDDRLELVNATETMDVKEGDFLVTSGIGRRFPAGYAVGTVKEVKRITGERFMKVLVVPSAHMDSSKNVLLIWTDFVAQLKRASSR
jgi:rod shape-determining protein MreC